MRKLAVTIVALAVGPSVGLAQQCAPRSTGAQCAAPGYCAPQCSAPQGNRESGLAQPEGAYIRGPESGEFESGSSSIGLKGFGFKLPALTFEGPEIRLPHLTKYRRNPSMVVESSRAPFVRGSAMEFNQVPRNESDKESAKESGTSPTPYQCIPPAPACTTENERRLRDELARKESEIREMRDRFSRLESAISELTQSQRDVSVRNRRPAKQPEILEAGYEREFDDESDAAPNQPVEVSRSRTARPVSQKMVPRRTPSVAHRTEPVWNDSVEEASSSNVGHSYITDEDEALVDDDGIGVWKGEALRPLSIRNRISNQRTSR